MSAIDACHDCLRRTELIAALSGRIEVEWRLRRGRPRLLALADERLLEWAADPAIARAYGDFRAGFAVDRLIAAGLGAVCRCSDGYPPALSELEDPPSVLHVAGDIGLLGRDAVAVVGARRASPYGLDLTGALVRGVAAAGVVTTSGMAMGIDSAAHAAALDGGGATVAVLATGADRPYPQRARALHRRIATSGCVVSELPPGTPPRRWAFPARNRLIAALSAGTVVVEGDERSGSLITADFAVELGRFVAAMPGPLTAPRSAGPHALIRAGAELVRDAGDVLDLLFGAGAREQHAPLVVGAGEEEAAPRAARPPAAGPTIPGDLSPSQRRVLEAVEEGRGTLAELVDDPRDTLDVSRDLGALELRGLIRRVFGGRYIRAA